MDIRFFEGPHHEVYIKVNKDATPYSLVRVQHQDTGEERIALAPHSDTMWKELEPTDRLGILVKYGDGLNEEKVRELYEESFVLGHLGNNWQVVNN